MSFTFLYCKKIPGARAGPPPGCLSRFLFSATDEEVSQESRSPVNVRHNPALQTDDDPETKKGPDRGFKFLTRDSLLSVELCKESWLLLGPVMICFIVCLPVDHLGVLSRS